MSIDKSPKYVRFELAMLASGAAPVVEFWSHVHWSLRGWNSHSLLSAIGWSLALALVYLGVRRYPKGAWVVGACVFSHWLLDALTHHPDLPLAPGSETFVGLGLWNSMTGTVLVELGLFFCRSRRLLTSHPSQGQDRALCLVGAGRVLGVDVLDKSDGPAASG